MQIPLVDLKRQYVSIKKDIDEAIQKVLNEGRFILGDNVRMLEDKIAKFCGVKFSIGVGSGTDALEFSLRALKIGEGDEVITTPLTFIATTESISQVGAKPVFADINLDTYLIDPEEVKKKVSKKTRAIIPVHLYGQSCQMDTLVSLAREYNLKIVEDCAQAIGAEYKGKKVGAFGNTGCFSFFPGKNLGAYGDGGMVVTDDEVLAREISMLRVHGSKDKYTHVINGRNSRLDEIQAAILNVKLKYIVEWNEKRNRNAKIYNDYLRNIGLDSELILPQEAYGSKHTYHLYVLRVKNRDKLRRFLNLKGINTGIHYPVPLHLQSVYRHMGFKKGDFPNSERVADEIISLPMFPELTEEEIKYIIDAISEFIMSDKKGVVQK